MAGPIQNVYFTNPIVNSQISSIQSQVNGINDPAWLANNFWKAENYSNLTYKNIGDVIETIELTVTGTYAPYTEPIGLQTGGTIYSLTHFYSYVDDSGDYPNTQIANPIDPAFSYLGSYSENSRNWFRQLSGLQQVLNPSNDPNGDMRIFQVLDLATGSDTATPNGDFTVWTTYLKTGCAFADGSPILARNIQAGWSRALTSTAIVDGYIAPYALSLSGASAYATADTFFSRPIAGTSNPVKYQYTPLESIKVIDDYTIEWHMGSSTPLWNQYLTFPYAVPVIIEDSLVGTSPTGPWVPSTYSSADFWKNPSINGRNTCSAAYYYTGIQGLSTSQPLAVNNQTFFDKFVVKSAQNPNWIESTDPTRAQYPKYLNNTYISNAYQYTGATGLVERDLSYYNDLQWESDIIAGTGPTSAVYEDYYVSGPSEGEVAATGPVTGTYGPTSLIANTSSLNAPKVWLFSQQKPTPGFETRARPIAEAFTLEYGFVQGSFTDTNGTFGGVTGASYTPTGAGAYLNVRRGIIAAFNRGYFRSSVGGSLIVPNYPRQVAPNSSKSSNSIMPYLFPDARDPDVEINGWKESDPSSPPGDIAGAVQYLELAKTEDGVTYPLRLNWFVPGSSNSPGTQRTIDFIVNTFFTGPLASYFYSTEPGFVEPYVGFSYAILNNPVTLMQNYDMFGFGWGSDYASPQGILQPLLAGQNCTGGVGVSNYGLINNPEIDTLLNTLEVQVANNQISAANATCIEIETISNENACFIPRGTTAALQVRPKGLNNVSYNISNPGTASPTFWITPEYQINTI
jgi:hypothetical protein